MTPGARVSAAIEVLDDYLLGKPVDKVLLNWFRANRFAGSKDRLAIRDLVFNCLRYKLSSHWPFQQAGFPIGGRVLLLGMLSDSDQCLEKFFDGKRYSPKTLSKLERVITKNFGEAQIDDAYSIDDHESLPILYDLIQNEGLSLGTSCGVNIAGAIRLGKELGPGKTIVTILCDRSDKYSTKMFNKKFLVEKGLPFPNWL